MNESILIFLLLGSVLCQNKRNDDPVIFPNDSTEINLQKSVNNLNGSDFNLNNPLLNPSNPSTTDNVHSSSNAPQILEINNSINNNNNNNMNMVFNENNRNRLPQQGCRKGFECVSRIICSNNTILQDRIDVGCVAPSVCCPVEMIVSISPSVSPSAALKDFKCGMRNFDGIDRIVVENEKDTETYFGEFPWMIAVIRKEIQNDGKRLNVYQCGGTLIDPYAVLTAAHCVAGEQAGYFKIRAGEWDTQSINESLPHQDRNVAQIVIHPDFQKTTLYNNVAILFLERPVEIANNVKTICLPPKGETFDYRNCYATGWGTDVFGREGRHQVILKKIGLPIIPKDECQSALRSTRLGDHFILHESFLCAGGEIQKDTCKGDGGSPLTCPILGNTRQYYQAGIVSWGIGCGDNNIPGVYANVEKFREWIDKTMVSKGLNNLFYSVG